MLLVIFNELLGPVILKKLIPNNSTQNISHGHKKIFKVNNSPPYCCLSLPINFTCLYNTRLLSQLLSLIYDSKFFMQNYTLHGIIRLRMRLSSHSPSNHPDFSPWFPKSSFLDFQNHAHMSTRHCCSLGILCSSVAPGIFFGSWSSPHCLFSSHAHPCL